MISEEQFIQCASLLKVEDAAIKSVAEVESGGSGIIDGRPVILFEPHIFWKELKKIDIDPRNYSSPAFDDILYPVWGTKPYPKGQDAQHARLALASKINREAALQSCSWGKFQIMGFNWKMCKCHNLQTFINAIYKSEDEHLRLFTNYILSAGLDDELRFKDWKGFARGYNGPLYARNSYDKKLLAAYNKFKSK